MMPTQSLIDIHDMWLQSLVIDVTGKFRCVKSAPQ